MNASKPAAIRLHEDVAFFREAVNFTTIQTQFAARLIEKDYFCTVFLAYMAGATDGQVVFKGGTCLAKVLLGFYRLSEDLDFVIPMPVTATRAERSRRATVLKDAVEACAREIPGFHITQPLRGASNSTQYIGEVAYRSPTTGQPEPIKIEVSLREPMLTPLLHGSVRTLLLDPIGAAPLVSNLTLPCISQTEAMAEKIRAAMTRREVAIRDFYDLHYAATTAGIHLDSPELVNLVRQKLLVPGNDPVQMGPRRLADLRRQLSGRLRPVLRQEDYERFDLDRAFEMVASILHMLR